MCAKRVRARSWWLSGLALFAMSCGPPSAAPRREAPQRRARVTPRRAPPKPRPAFNPSWRKLPILPGKGTRLIRLGDPMSLLLKRLGKPTVNDKYDIGRVLRYGRPGTASTWLDFAVFGKQGRVGHLRFNKGYQGKLPNGIGLNSTLEEVLKKYGGAKRTITTWRQNMRGCSGDRVLCKITNVNRGKHVAWRFADSCRGMAFWFDARTRRLLQITVGYPRQLCSCKRRAASGGKPATSTGRLSASALSIVAGKGLTGLRIGDDAAKARKLLGEPDTERKVPRHELRYWNRHALTVTLRKGSTKIESIRIVEGFGGKLKNGLGLCSPLKAVLKLSGGARYTAKTTIEKGRQFSGDRLLFRIQHSNRFSHIFVDDRRGLRYWFDKQQRVTEMTLRTPSP